MRPLTSRPAILLAFLISLFVTAPGQDLDNVTIAGVVKDSFGALVLSATITTSSSQSGIVRSIEPDEHGRFVFLKLPPGEYTLLVRANGFVSQEVKSPALIAGQQFRSDFVLQPQGIFERVVVTDGDVSRIDTTRTVVGGTVERRELDSLPLFSRNALDLVFTLPGITEEPLSTRDLAEDRNINHATTPEEAGRFSLSGGPAFSNNLTIDGLDNNDDRTARERFEPSPDAIQEVQVITNQFAAEYGRASGGRVNIRTRGGTNSFHGRMFYYFRDEALNANTFRNNTLGLKRLPLQEHNPGFTLSGPISRGAESNASFFGAYEFDTQLDHALIDTLLPVAQHSLFPLPQPTILNQQRVEDVSEPALSTTIAPYIATVNTPFRSHKLTLRYDQQFSQSHSASIVFHQGIVKNLRQFSGGSRLADALQAQVRNSMAVSYMDNFVISAKDMNEFRFQLSSLNPQVKSLGTGPVVLISINDSLESDDPAHRTGTVVAGSSSTGSTSRRENRVQLQETVTLLRGQHTTRFGGDLNRISSAFMDLGDVSGTYSFASAGDFLTGKPNRFRQNFFTDSSQGNTYLAVFAQDEWRPKEGILLTVGLRYERESIIRDNNNWAPRVSAAYDPWKRGTTVFRLGAGLFYNRALLRTVDDFTLGEQQLFFDTNTLTDESGRLLSAAARREFIANYLHFPSTLRADSQLVQQFADRNNGFIRRLDPGLRIPESYQANFGVEHHIGRGFTVEANFTLNRGIHLWREFNVNAPQLPPGFDTFSSYLTSRDFANFRTSSTGLRPLYNASNAGELVRFTFDPVDPSNGNAVVRIFESGLPISVINLNSISGSTAVDVALAALNKLRPDPNRGELEQLISAGNSFYRALTVELRQRFWQANGWNASFRVAYTLSRLLDDGIVNTSDAIVPGAFHLERARSLLDRRHRFVFSGTFDLPKALASLRIAPVVRFGSAAPFNISLNGADRNLDDVGNDRPIYLGDRKLLRWRRPGEPISPALLTSFRLPAIGETGNLPRNAGMGPGLSLFDVNVSREFPLTEGVQLRGGVEVNNVLNQTVFNFGSEFINFNALSSNATDAQRQAFADTFLVPTRTLRQRQVRVGLRLEF